MPGAIATPRYAPCGRDRDEHRRGTEAHDDQRRAEARAAADRGGDQIGADLGGVSR